ncbi:hypothetical protein KM295_09660 [Natronomonas sp. F2-12]|jgi:hypothetical protein|uniref:Uncharacterized protein n=1 Tax=Natronomonas aquatica TaxID=2841590 RepID=A0A9R1CTQ3_9EURY|nr:hypothetical protein [Natronomonas aquatica]MCQ4333740.1 hypothetical protein [Natronomonas aquatica]
MTPSTPTNDRRAPTSASLPAPIRAGAFWAAVLLPFCALGLLASGLSSPVEYAAFVSLVAVNVLALIAGHDHGAE